MKMKKPNKQARMIFHIMVWHLKNTFVLPGDAGLPVSRGSELKGPSYAAPVGGGTLQGYHSLGADFEVKMMETEATRELLKANMLNQRMIEF